jgi:type I restriction enzyme, S subunit
MPACIPDSEIAIRFSRLNHLLLERILENRHQNIVLSSIRDSLLPKLISGEIRLPTKEEGGGA